MKNIKRIILAAVLVVTVAVATKPYVSIVADGDFFAVSVRTSQAHKFQTLFSK